MYASLANGTLVVFTPKTTFSERRVSHNDVTLVTKEEDELLTRETKKWSDLQVRLFFHVSLLYMFLLAESFKADFYTTVGLDQIGFLTKS